MKNIIMNEWEKRLIDIYNKYGHENRMAMKVWSYFKATMPNVGPPPTMEEFDQHYKEYMDSLVTNF